ncbi:hypothetical protein ncot_15045 [Nocardioides sp. JQ2195]|uniref:hypothetical protein n=1 Tax=Nocardioides sp. JQ2195 TaxID=2592334 RepID=UPI00143E7B5A|nr:hypothetical protein [Nocardioides sp. JQ2195]QIX27763.1 hypothetical protein ncot_15045 [Nocardioides sp. JQ2195]
MPVISEAMRSVEALATEQASVVSRTQAYAAGLSRGVVRAQVRARRWQVIGCHSICLHNGPLSEQSLHWAAVIEAGPRAMLDGATALVAGGLSGYTTERIRVSVPRGARIRHRGSGVDIRQTRRWASNDLAPTGVPRTRPAVAAIRAALWARSDKQAALLLTMTAQQGLATPEQMGVEMLRVRRHRRRGFVHQVLLDLIGGVRAVSELEFARECRSRGLPEPTRQVVRKGANGSYFLDVVWEEWNVVTEIDGIHHTWAANLVTDALRHNDLTLTDATVLRLPLLGLRVAADEFFAQIEAALRAAGWSGRLPTAV